MSDVKKSNDSMEGKDLVQQILASWNDGAPKYDIRDGAPEYEKMGNGTTLAKEEVLKLKEILDTLF